MWKTVMMSVLMTPVVHDGTSVSVHLLVYITHTLHKAKHWRNRLIAPAPLYRMNIRVISALGSEHRLVIDT